MRSRLNTLLGQESPATAVANYRDGCINRAYETVVRASDKAYWLRRHFSFITLPQLTSTTAANGVVVATGGSRLVELGSELRVDRRYIGGYLRIASQQETYLITDVIRAGVAPGAGAIYVSIDPPYSGVAFGSQTTNANGTITQINYRMPPDFLNTYTVKQSAGPLQLWAKEPATLDRWIPDPVILGQTGDPYLYLIAHGSALADFWGTRAMRSGDLLVAPETVMTGICTFTNNSNRVAESAYLVAGWNHNAILSADSTTDATRLTRNTLQGRFIRATGDPRWYRIADIRDTDTGVANSILRLLLDEPFQGTTATGEYTIDGSDTCPWMRLYPIPITAINIDMEYHAMPPILQGTNEEPRLPSQLHGVVLDGASMHLLRYMKDERMVTFENEFNAGLIRAQQAGNPMGDRRRVMQATPRWDGGFGAEHAGTWPTSIET